jgi:hypothetical protein
MEAVEGTTGGGKTDVFTKFLAELEAGGIDPTTVFLVADEMHEVGAADEGVAQRLRELVGAGRRAAVVLERERTPYERLRRYWQYPSLAAMREAGLFDDLETDRIVLRREEMGADRD